MESQNGILTERLRRIYLTALKYWYISASFTILPGLWFVLVEFYGPSAGWISDTGPIPWVLNVSWVAFFASLFYAYLKSFGDFYNNKLRTNGQAVLTVLIEGSSHILSKKYDLFVRHIEDRKEGISEALDEIIKPEEQIETICRQLVNSFMQLFDINRNSISVSIIYKFSEDKKWKWLYRRNTNNDANLKQLLKQESSSVYQILNNNKSEVFFARKQDGIDQNQYFSSKRDRENDNKGSIICRDVSIEANGRCIEAILSVSTYGKQICEPRDIESITKIKNLIMPIFEERIRLELAFLYLRDHHTTEIE